MSPRPHLRVAVDAWRILRDEREATRNPWFDPASDERLLAAAFADRVVFIVCLTIGLLLLADFIAPDFAAWLTAQAAETVTR